MKTFTKVLPVLVIVAFLAFGFTALAQTSSGTNTSDYGSSSTGTSGSSSTGTSGTGTSGTSGTTGTSSSTPGLPNTGAGGDAAANIALMTMSLGGIAAGAYLTMRQKFAK